MTENTQTQTTSALRACLVVRDPDAFALLIEDMSEALGDAWGELNPSEAHVFLNQPDAHTMDCIIVAVDEDDRDTLPTVAAVLERAKSVGVPALLVAEDLTATELHRLIQAGAKDFLPYPLPQGALARAIEGLKSILPPVSAPAPAPSPVSGKNGALFVVQGLAGGTGATTLAVGLADELAELGSHRVCLIDLDLQFGSCGSALSCQPRETVLDLLTNVDTVDADGFTQALQHRPNGLQVLTAPGEIVPLDMISDAGLARLLSIAQAEFDYVVVDMPKSIVGWSEIVLTSADVVFCPIELDIRSAQAASRFRAILSAESIALEQLRFVLNRAPKFTDLAGKSRVKRLAEVLQSSLDILLPDGGRVVANAADQGVPLSEAAPKSIYRRDVQFLARSIAEHGLSGDVAA